MHAEAKGWDMGAGQSTRSLDYCSFSVSCLHSGPFPLNSQLNKRAQSESESPALSYPGKLTAVFRACSRLLIAFHKHRSLGLDWALGAL